MFFRHFRESITKAFPRLRGLAPRPEAGSHNLEKTFLRFSVFAVFLHHLINHRFNKAAQDTSFATGKHCNVNHKSPLMHQMFISSSYDIAFSSQNLTGVRLCVTPATRCHYRQMQSEGMSAANDANSGSRKRGLSKHQTEVSDDWSPKLVS